jgi:hypothetical protein
MKSFCIAAAAAAGAVSAQGTNIYLPHTHTVRVTRQLSDNEVFLPLLHFEEGEFLHVWRDNSTQRALYHIYEDSAFERRAGFVLQDYAKGVQYKGRFGALDTVHDCVKELTEGSWGPVIVMENAQFQGPLTLAGNFLADAYQSYVSHKGREFIQNGIVEANTHAQVVQLTNTAVDELDGHYYVDFLQFFDLTTHPIPDNVFTIPEKCPK